VDSAAGIDIQLSKRRERVPDSCCSFRFAVYVHHHHHRRRRRRRHPTKCLIYLAYSTRKHRWNTSDLLRTTFSYLAYPTDGARELPVAQINYLTYPVHCIRSSNYVGLLKFKQSLSCLCPINRKKNTSGKALHTGI